MAQSAQPPDASITLPDVQTTAAAPTSAPATRQAPLYGNWTPAFFQPHRRSIGGIVAQVTIEEQGSDDVQITEHPVEQGAPIADHAFKRPATVTIRAGWSRQYAWDLSAETGVYGLLLSWQASLIPFNVITGKRSYSNMLIARLQITTDNHTEFALMATITCQQIIIVGTATTEVTGMSQDGNSHADPASTGPSGDNGTKPGVVGGSVLEQQTPEGPGNVPLYGPPAPPVNVPPGGMPPPETMPSPPDALPTPPSNIPSTYEGSGAFGNIAGVQATTPQAAAVQNQMTANGAATPNSPSVDPFREGF